MRLFKKKRKRQTNTGFKKFVTTDELKRLLDSFGPREEHNKLICMLLAFCGFRISAAVTTKLDNFADNFRLLTLYEKKQKKYITRELPEPFRHYVVEYCKRHYHTFKDGYLFASDNPSSVAAQHEHITAKSFAVLFRRKMKELNMRHVYYQNKKINRVYSRLTPHALRHFYVTHLINASDGNIELVRQLMSYSKASTISQYYFDPNFVGIRGKLINTAFTRYFENTPDDPGQGSLKSYIG